MSRRRMGLDFDGAGFILGVDPLDGVEVVLAHIGQPAALVVPIATMAAAESMTVERS